MDRSIPRLRVFYIRFLHILRIFSSRSSGKYYAEVSFVNIWYYDLLPETVYIVPANLNKPYWRVNESLSEGITQIMFAFFLLFKSNIRIIEAGKDGLSRENSNDYSNATIILRNGPRLVIYIRADSHLNAHLMIIWIFD